MSNTQQSILSMFLSFHGNILKKFNAFTVFGIKNIKSYLEMKYVSHLTNCCLM